MRIVAVSSASMAALLFVGLNVATAQARPAWAPLDPTYLKQMYANKTWVWKQGAAYFGEDGRFKAWSRTKGEVSTGSGSWEVRDGGIMCFTAQWHLKGSPESWWAPPPLAEACFEHDALGRAIAQRKDPDGEWYMFKHARTRQNDEFLKLRAGDHTGLGA